jgi:3-phenylpropionate/trans-cinnamate dioxygenase ferredoxin reductase subunit
MGKAVTVFEEKDRVMARVTSPTVAAFYEAEHREHGVVIRTQTKVESFIGDGARLTGVRLADGETVPAQVVIVGIGIAPCVAPLQAAGAACSDGVDVDAYCRTSLRDVFAVGDCASFTSAYTGGTRLRLESVQNATDQATTAAKTIVGREAPYSAVPWFWSNQFDLKLQVIGLSAGYDCSIVRGAVTRRGFSVAYLRDGVLIAIDAVNRPRDYVQARTALLSRVSPTQMDALGGDQELNSIFPPPGHAGAPQSVVYS